MRLGLSTVSEEGARANLRGEIPGWDFNAVKKAAEAEWEKALSCITVEKSLSEDDKVKLYTSLYHTMIAPSLINDVDGNFFGWDWADHHSDTPVYTTFSLWDTYRALHPLYNLIKPEANRFFIRSMLEFNREKGFLPIHVFGISEALRMIGIHSLPVIADAITQDLGGFDVDEAYDAMHALALNDSVPYVRATPASRNKNPYTKGIGDLLKIGYVPSENEREAVSKTMEYAYDHWCVAEAARKLGKEDDAAFFDKMGLNYSNVIDTTIGFARGRHADGSWVTPFNPDWVTSDEHHDFTEGNAWQYTFYVPQDMTNYIEMLGGDVAFATKLDEMFTRRLSDEDNNVRDVSGLIGQYAHGNEPSHQIAYLYNFVGQPWKTQKLVNQIKTELYSTANDGLCGNEDCGQMSAWYIFSAMGFYPVTPAIGYYVIGQPTFPEATLKLEGGKSFKIKAENLSDKNIYVQGVTLNGRPYEKSWISISDIKKGGTLVFDMGSSPSEWGAAPEDRPVSKIVLQ